MGSILQNQTVKPRRASPRQREYLLSRKTERRNVVKHEQIIQNELCRWFLDNFPGEHFISDTGAGAFGRFTKVQHVRQQSHKGEPDIKILAARRGYHGLLIELKADCKHKTEHKDCMIRMQRNGTKVRVYKDSSGRITDRDYKVRLKGDWISPHVERQAQVLEDYNKKGYLARFAVGLERAKQLICWYFDVPYEEPNTLF